MHDPILGTLGLALRAGRLEVGEEPVGGACRGHIARLIVVAADAAPNTLRRARHFGESWNVMCLSLPFSKDELGRALGRSTCAVAAVTDPGFAVSIGEKLARLDPDRYGSAASELAQRVRTPKHHASPSLQPEPGPQSGPPVRPKHTTPPRSKTSSKPGVASKPKTPPGPRPGSSRGGNRGGFAQGPVGKKRGGFI